MPARDATPLPRPSEDLAPAEPLEETRAALADLAGKRFGKLPVAPFVELILDATEGADWPVRKAAMEALLRRVGFAKRDATRVLARPGRATLGCYRVGSAARSDGRAARRYRTELCSLEPLRTSCDCPDYVRGSLGLCKHGLAVLLSLGPSAFRDPRPRRRRDEPARLRWNPIAPLSGPQDRLARLTLVGTPRAAAQFERQRPASDEDGAPARRLRWIQGLIDSIRARRVRAEPAAARVLEEEHERTARLASNARELKRSEASIRKLRRKLYDYQKQGVLQFLRTGRLLLADDMGLGKTTQAIACCHALFQTGRIDRGLLVVPAALRSQWLREWRETSSVELREVSGSPAERARVYRQTKRGLLLIGYELLLRDLPEVQRLAPQLVLLDEAQRIKNWETKSAASVKSLDAEFRLVLTGTPMENRFEELASIMDFVDDTALEPKWRLVPWHSWQVGDGGAGRAGARNLDVLRQRLGRRFLRRRRAEVLAQLPPRTDTRVAVELTPEQSAEHAQLDRPIASLVRKARHRPLLHAEFLQLMQLLTTQRMICNGLAQVNFAEEWPRCQATTRRSERFLGTLFAPKLTVFRDLVEQIVVEQGRKVVVFSQWRSMLRLAQWSVEDRLSAAGLNARFFTGAESRAVRERALIDFHDDPASRLLFSSDAGATGLNLQRAASCCINLELPWNPAVLEQRIARVYRLGQEQPVEVLNLVSEGGIESRIADLVAQKQAVFSALFDGTTDEVLFDGDRSFVSGVEKLVSAELPDQTLSDSDTDSADELEELAAAVAEGDAASDESGAGSNGAGAGPTRGLGAGSPAIDSAARAVSPAAGFDPAALGQALAGLSIQPTAAGGLRIEAPPALAVPLARALEGIAAALRQTAERARDAR